MYGRIETLYLAGEENENEHEAIIRISQLDFFTAVMVSCSCDGT